MILTLLIITILSFWYYFSIGNLKRKEKIELLEKYSKRDIMTAIELELKEMESRLEFRHNMQSLACQVRMYNSAYKEFPFNLEKIRKETETNALEIEKLVTKTAENARKTKQEVLEYLRPFPFMKFYFEIFEKKI